MEYCESSNKQSINEGDDLNPLKMIQHQQEMYGENDFPLENFDNAEFMHLHTSSDAENNQNNNENNTKKKHLRHTAFQIQQLEAVFREFPHPDERLRFELSQRLGLDLKQIKFWFQNKRTQIKAQTEHNTNILLKEENDKLRQENAALKAALTHPLCRNCILLQPPVSFNGKSPTVENALLMECYSAYASAASNINKGIRTTNEYYPTPRAIRGSSSKQPATMSYKNVTGKMPPILGLPASSNGNNNLPRGTMVHNESRGGSMVELAVKAMDQLLRMADQNNISLWIKDGKSEVLNVEEYVRIFPPVLSVSPTDFAHEASRETVVVISPSQALVDTFMDPEQWMKMFPSVISDASTIQLICPGVDGTKNGTVQLMEAELQVLSPVVPLCKLKFLRYCKKFGVGKWAVVDVAADTFSGEPPYLPFRLFPSGCIIQEFPNACSQVTWVGHYEYDETAVAPLYRPMLRAGLGFGSIMWLQRLKRQCHCISFFTQSAPAQNVHQNFTGKEGLLHLAQRMSDSFCYGISGSRFQWELIQNGNVGNNYVFIKSRMSIEQPGEPYGNILSVTTSFWLPVNKNNLFHCLRDVNLRNQWDTLSQDAGFCTLLNVNKGPNDTSTNNKISIFHANDNTLHNTVILQDTWSDESAFLIVYAPIQICDIQSVLDGRDSRNISFLPSGFAIYPDNQMIQPSGFFSNQNLNDQSHLVNMGSVVETNNGSLLTVGFQVLVNLDPLKVVEEENFQVLNSHVVQTCNKIREAMGCA